MAALLARIHLGRHALPGFIAARLDRELDRRAAQQAAIRPRLAVAWHVGPDGRLACRWADTGAAAAIGQQSG
ncbi:MAG TPA: hypothetical protein VFG12_02660 [Rhodopila sp.]|jgi:hypothetical protein|nr:hypothetical protein [Rhodopila sp.]